MIKWMDLGNLSGHAKIPEYYIRCFLGYVVQVSQAMSYAHKHNLIHGQFDLSKVIIQQQTVDEGHPYRSRQESFKYIGNTRQRSYNHKDFNYNFFITNFEPYQIAIFLQKIYE